MCLVNLPPYIFHTSFCGCLRAPLFGFIQHSLGLFFSLCLLSFQLTQSQVTGVACKFLVILLHYFRLTNFFWMLVEGMLFSGIPIIQTFHITFTHYRSFVLGEIIYHHEFVCASCKGRKKRAEEPCLKQKQLWIYIVIFLLEFLNLCWYSMCIIFCRVNTSSLSNLPRKYHEHLNHFRTQMKASALCGNSWDWFMVRKLRKYFIFSLLLWLKAVK